MGKKIPSLITSINIDRATFHNASVEKLSFINFFYSTNGAGRSSVAYAIEEAEGVPLADGRSRDDHNILVYNRNFMDENFSSYGDLKNVFIVNKVNKKVQAQIDAKTTLLTSFQNECRDKTVDLRTDFSDALEGKNEGKICRNNLW